MADIIHVSKEYEIAIETALGGSISNIVTDNEQTAKSMIQFLKKNRFGRATFLPLTSIRGRRAENADRICGEEGVIGLASDLIRVDSQFGHLADYLLGRVFIVDHIDHALALAKKYRYSLRIVTLEGESLNPGGSLSGGAYKNTGNLLGRHREMEELQKHVETLSAKLILADEPTGALDSRAAQMLLETFRKMNHDMHSTILMVTHDAFSASYCSRILFLKDGKIFHELVRGVEERREFLNKILDVLSLTGGELSDVR